MSLTRTLLRRAGATLAVGAICCVCPVAGAADQRTTAATANFRAIDTDRDARLDRNELAAAAAHDFDRLDIDHDGYLTRQELDETRGRGLLLPFPGRFERKAAFVAADTDGDGRIDKREYETAVVAAYMKCDRNRDGTIELSDLRHCGR